MNVTIVISRGKCSPIVTFGKFGEQHIFGSNCRLKIEPIKVEIKRQNVISM